MRRFFLGLSALVLTVGALMHASAFKKIASAIADSNLAPFAGNSLKVLWLADSATALVLAAVFTLIATRPGAAKRSIIILLAFIPAATAALIYIFIGAFAGGHIMLAAAIAALLGGVMSAET